MNANNKFSTDLMGKLIFVFILIFKEFVMSGDVGDFFCKKKNIFIFHKQTFKLHDKHPHTHTLSNIYFCSYIPIYL